MEQVFSIKQSSDIGTEEKERLWRLLGRGICYDDILDDLVRTTINLKTKYARSSIVWALHFPVGTIKDDRLALVGWEKIRDASIQTDIRVILAGHIHEDKRIAHGECEVFVAGSCCAVDIPVEHSFSIFEIETTGSALLSLRRDRYDYEKGAFRKTATEQKSYV